MSWTHFLASLQNLDMCIQNISINTVLMPVVQPIGLDKKKKRMNDYINVTKMKSENDKTWSKYW